MNRLLRLAAFVVLVAALAACDATPTPTAVPPAVMPVTAGTTAPQATKAPSPAAPATAALTALPTAAPVAAAPAVPPNVGGSGGPTATLIITWYGQSTFVLSASSGLKALLDPAGSSTGYTVPTLDGIDLVTVSHEHSDHNVVSLAAGTPLVLHGLAGNDWAKIDQTVKGVRVRTVATYHDDTQGSQRGKNASFIFEIDGLRLAHLGDLGHTLSAEQVKDIGPLDAIMIPVGGFYTIDAKQATEVVNQLNPKIVIPMHFKTADVAPSLAGRLAAVDDFTKAMGDKAAIVQAGQTITIERSTLPAGRTLMVMKYKSP